MVRKLSVLSVSFPVEFGGVYTPPGALLGGGRSPPWGKMGTHCHVSQVSPLPCCSETSAQPCSLFLPMLSCMRVRRVGSLYEGQNP